MATGTTNPWECGLCLESYDETHRRPRGLPCGHPFCSPCVTKLIKNGQLTCPICLADHTADSSTQFPISLGMEELIKQLRPRQGTATERRVQQHLGTSSKTLQALRLEQEGDMKGFDTVCDCLLKQMDEYEATVVDWQEDHGQLIARLKSLVTQNEAALQLLKKQQNDIQDMRRQIKACREQRQKCVASVSSVQEALTAVEELHNCKAEMKNWIQKCQELFPNGTAVRTSQKVREVTRLALDSVITETSSAEATPSLPDTTIHSPEKLATIMEKVNLIIFSVEDLRQKGELVEALLKADRVVAVQEGQEGLRYSRITVQDGRLHLHTLQRRPKPDNVYTLEHSGVVSLVDSSSTVIFLDLGWRGSTRGRVYIRLSPNSRLAEQFLLLCTGERGPSYCNTKCWTVVRSNWGDFVCGGDYESNDGKGGASLLSGLELEESIRKPFAEGMVTSRFVPGDVTSSQFLIYTTAPPAGGMADYVYGQVESGLEVLKEAVRCGSVKKMKVNDCGVVLPL